MGSELKVFFNHFFLNSFALDLEYRHMFLHTVTHTHTYIYIYMYVYYIYTYILCRPRRPRRVVDSPRRVVDSPRRMVDSLGLRPRQRTRLSRPRSRQRPRLRQGAQSWPGPHSGCSGSCSVPGRTLFGVADVPLIFPQFWISFFIIFLSFFYHFFILLSLTWISFFILIWIFILIHFAARRIKKDKQMIKNG